MSTDLADLLPRSLREFRRIERMRRHRIRSRRALVVAGRFDLGAVMREATYAARVRRGLTGEAWQVCIADALSGTWFQARAERASGVQRPRIYVTIR